jgi:GR25 family glycosyltransferase involved in LPS biosynthesis
MVTWNGIKIADKGFLINLKERTDRLNESLQEFDKLNIRGVEIFDAIKITEDSDYGWKIRGCTHSHYEILKYQVDNSLERVVIFEDDFCYDVATTNTNFQMSDEIIHGINNIDSDVLFLGACLLDKAKIISDNTLKPNTFVQTTCYISNYKFAEFVVKHFNYLDKKSIVYGEQIDSFYSVLSSKQHWTQGSQKFDEELILNNNLKILFHYPILFSQRPSYSDITNRKVNLLMMNKMRNLQNYK